MDKPTSLVIVATPTQLITIGYWMGCQGQKLDFTLTAREPDTYLIKGGLFIEAALQRAGIRYTHAS